MSDLHIPFHDTKAIEATIKHAVAYKPNLLLLNGDVHDCYSLSYWTKDPRLRDFPKELDILKQFFEYIRERLKCDIIWKLGNHEKRLEIYAHLMVECNVIAYFCCRIILFLHSVYFQSLSAGL